MPKGQIHVRNKHHYKCEPIDSTYIGRGSPLGNPFTVALYGRDPCIQMYEGWLHEQLALRNEKVIDALDKIANRLIEGKDVELMCFCKPLNCHGEIIKKIVMATIEAQ